jgi:DNA repair protein RadC
MPAWTKAAEIELSYKTKLPASQRPLLDSSISAFELFRNHWDDNKMEFMEQFKVALVNRASRVLGIYEVSTGGTNGTVVDPRLIFVAALKANACGILLCHNHASGNLQPSLADKQLTAKVAEAWRFLNLQVLDHLIITREGFYSFAEEGLL